VDRLREVFGDHGNRESLAEKKFGLNTRVHNFLAVKTKKNRWAEGAGTKLVPEKIITGEIRKR
jgi:hypothetical protein